MKKTLLIITLTLYLLIFGSYAETPEDDYTLLIYMNGSTLESDFNYFTKEFVGSATKDLEEMIEGYKGDDNINIIVQTMGTKRWNNDFVSSNETQRFLLTEDGFKLQYSLPLQNVGYKKTLSDFITWTSRNYPAKKYGLIMWNHGGGPVNGFGIDEQFNGNRLHLEEMDSALEKAKEVTDIHFEFIGFDACIMSSLEIADTLAPYANYLLASEDLEPSHGWNYTALLKELHIEPDMTGDRLGKIIGDSYAEEAKEKSEVYNITFSVIDLSKIDVVVQAFNALVKELDVMIEKPSEFYNFAIAAAKSRNLGGNSATQGYTDLIDIVDFSNNISARFDVSTKELIDAINDSVLYNLDTSRAHKTSGLSIYFPLKDKEKMEENLELYSKTGFSQTYIDFITNFQKKMTTFTENDEIEYDLKKPNKDTIFYHINFDEEDIDKISEVYLRVFMLNEDDDLKDYSYVGLGYSNNTYFDEANASYKEQFDKDWLFLDNQPLSLSILSDNEDTIEYEVPVIYNGQGMLLLFSYDKVTKASTIQGLKAGYDPFTGKVDNEFYQLKKGDTIIPMYQAYHDIRKHFEWVEGKEIIVTDNTTIKRKNIEADAYIIAFIYKDYSYERYMTDLFEFER